jgi:hypothetical protein
MLDFKSNRGVQLFKIYRSARTQAKLKRLLSQDAFAGALEQSKRWHLYYDGLQIVSVIAQGKGPTRVWSEGPPMTVAELGRSEVIQTRAKEIRRQATSEKGVYAGLGVVLHLADQLGQGIVDEEFENPEFFEQAGTLIREMPSRVVTDLSEEIDPTIQWRYYPLLSGQRALALRHQVEFLNAFKTLENLDVKVAIHSAPVETVALYLKLYEQSIEGKAHCFVFFYDRYTILVPVHEGVLDFKVLSHRQQDVPPSFGDDLFSLLERLGFVDSCVLLLVKCGTHEPTLLFNELDTYARRNQKDAEGIEIQIPDHETVWSVLNEWAQGQLKPSIVERPEFLSEYTEWFGNEFPLTLGIQGDVKRFGALSRQTFWPDDQETRDKRLPRTLAMLMLGLRIGQVCGFLFLIGLAAWFAIYVATAYNGEALKMLPEAIRGQQTDFEHLNSTKQYLAKWDKILMPRSQAWSAMDFVLGVLPEGNDLICEKMDYTIKQADARATGGQPSAAAGFSRQWVIDGFCNDQGRVVLARLQEASVLTKIFAITSERLEDPSFVVSGNRTVKAVLREEANPQYGVGAQGNAGSVLPYQFRLVVTQTIPVNDPLAIQALPKPKKTVGQNEEIFIRDHRFRHPFSFGHPGNTGLHFAVCILELSKLCGFKNGDIHRNPGSRSAICHSADRTQTGASQSAFVENGSVQ